MDRVQRLRGRPRPGPDPRPPVRAHGPDEQGRPHPLAAGHRDGVGATPTCPHTPRGDAGGELTGKWTDRDSEVFADRMEAEIEEQAPGFRSLITAPAPAVSRPRSKRATPTSSAARSAAAPWRCRSSSCSGRFPGSVAPRRRSAACSSRRRRHTRAAVSTAPAARTRRVPRWRPIASTSRGRAERDSAAELAQLARAQRPARDAERREVERTARFDLRQHRAVARRPRPRASATTRVDARRGVPGRRWSLRAHSR